MNPRMDDYKLEIRYLGEEDGGGFLNFFSPVDNNTQGVPWRILMRARIACIVAGSLSNPPWVVD